ncbi:hypothetical protein VMCG_05975 [Cytospora schulzeri]|uniref:Uncharacterized protein n=1 Tax=Cytospora schulzeri TaxID=448051 RepID=A0A423WCY9_9PEZI|nr:hypothetical protein VMCG_05975 [Valsa malicola]
MLRRPPPAPGRPRVPAPPPAPIANQAGGSQISTPSQLLVVLPKVPAPSEDDSGPYPSHTLTSAAAHALALVLAEVPHALVGGGACSVLGHSRQTADIDAVVCKGQTSVARGRLNLYKANLLVERGTLHTSYLSQPPVEIEILTPPKLFQEPFDETTPAITVVVGRATTDKKLTDASDIRLLLRYCASHKMWPTATECPKANKEFVDWFGSTYGKGGWAEAGWDFTNATSYSELNHLLLVFCLKYHALDNGFAPFPMYPGPRTTKLESLVEAPATMSLCSLCLTVPWLSLPPTKDNISAARVADNDEMLEVWYDHPAYRTQHNEATNQPLGLPFHENLQALALSAKLCPLCGLVQSGVCTWINTWQDAAKNHKGFIEYHMEKDPIPANERLWVTQSYGGAQGFYVWGEHPKKKSMYLLTAVGFSIDGGMTLSIFQGLAYFRYQNNPSQTAIYPTSSQRGHWD